MILIVVDRVSGGGRRLKKGSRATCDHRDQRDPHLNINL